ncbi:YceD family protein [Segatella bryantii]|jgi:uncharacterized metal-binding protein YceD (DUF177 family)|uniref:YceD family protein n=1 Tax=Segatella bryantii TaxID=77095 RepID=UPI00242C0946|nr:DUF177 domain-containing protein [Segatella bryantii]MEE3414121.1 DUF177 domain-containing protein [Prevotella sp.]
MCSLESFKIDLKALPQGITEMQLKLDDGYFLAIEASDIHRGDLVCTLSIQRVDDFFKLNFHIEGLVHIPCDLCLDDMEQSIDTDNKLVVKFGEDYSEEDDLVTVAEDEGILDVSWFIYEFIVLDIPIKHVHTPGNCNSAMIRLLEEHSAVRSGEEEESTVDPRWEALKNLKLKD